MYVCHHCGHITREAGVNYCNNENCKYYGSNKPSERPMPQEKNTYAPDQKIKRSLMKTDSMTFSYDGDINYPSDKRTYNMSGMGMNAGMGYMPDNAAMPHSTADAPKSMKDAMHERDYKSEYKQPDNNYSHGGGNSGGVGGTSCGSMGFATVPMQKPERLYTPMEALKAGTVFPSLDMPYDKKIIWRG